MKHFMIIIFLLASKVVMATGFEPKTFEEYAARSENIVLIDIIKKENINKGCIRVTAQAVDSLDKIIGDLTFFVLRDDDFLDESKPYLVFLSRAGKSINSKCLGKEGALYVKGIVQSMFPVMNLDFCDLDKKCDFLVQRQSIFHSKINSNERFVKYFTFENKRIYAIASVTNIKKQIREVRASEPGKLGKKGRKLD